MATKNHTVISGFILLGFTRDPATNIELFVLFFMIYVVTVAGNGLIMCMVFINPQLHKPMYFFLCMLSILDMCYSSTAVPRLLGDLISADRSISYGACAVQIYVILLVEGSECLLLALMAYDRYVAICQPLYYSVLMRWSVCYKLAAVILIASFTMCVFPSFFMQVTLCGDQINHFMCELLAILKLSCMDISSNELLIFSISFLSLLLPLVLIIVSYGCIIASVLKIRTAGRSKAFSTCTSHLAVVALYFGTVMLMYFGPSSQYSTNQEKYSSIFYVILSTMLNPLIYSLNNREVKDTFRKQVSKLNHFIFSNVLTFKTK
ncbi:olfactory receptor 2B6-like [Pseudophryne corroboree]|uniref:olfactory receptor 2B6-like n=1 Tax=Pseudophryne corroboree TaxID=495146 RepID=UPI003081EC2C